MAQEHRRSDRVAEAIREEVARFLMEYVKDPRIRGLVTVTAVDLTRDLRHAKVFVSVLGSDADRSASATNVSVPFVQPPVGNVGDPTTNRFSWSCVRPCESTTLVDGSVPMRHPPAG